MASKARFKYYMSQLVDCGGEATKTWLTVRHLQKMRDETRSPDTTRLHSPAGRRDSAKASVAHEEGRPGEVAAYTAGRHLPRGDDCLEDDESHANVLKNSETEKGT